MKKNEFEKFCEQKNKDKEVLHVCKKGRKPTIVFDQNFKIGTQIGFFLKEKENFDIMYFYRVDLHYVNMERIKSICEWKKLHKSNYFDEDISYKMKLLHISDFFEILIKVKEPYKYFVGRENFDHIYKGFMKSIFFGESLGQHPNIKELKLERLQLKIDY